MVPTLITLIALIKMITGKDISEIFFVAVQT
jgi:hypothetical protein